MGSIYRFVTRTMLYNSIEFIKAAVKKTFATFSKYRNSLTIAILLIILFVVGSFIAVDGKDSFLMSFPLMMVFLIVPILLFFNIICVIFNLQYSDGTYEPKIVRWVCRKISNFFKDATRPLDEQEKLDRQERKKIRKRKEKERKEKEMKRNAELEARKVKENKFNRFEVMDVE